MAFKGSSAVTSAARLYKLFNPAQKKLFIWLIFFTFISSVTDLIGLAFVLPLVSLVLSPESYNTLIHHFPALSSLSKEALLLYSAGLFFIIIILKNAFGLYINKLQVNFVKHFYVTSSMNVLEKIYKRPLLDIQKDTSNELVSKVTYYQAVLCSNAAISTIILINEAIIFLLTAVSICALDWKLFLLLIGVMLPVMGTFYNKVKNLIKNAGLEKTANGTKLYANAQEMIFGYTDIKIAGTEKNFKKQFEEYAKNYSIFQARLDFMMFIPTRIIEITIFMCIIMILLYGVFVIKDPEKIVATITMFSIIAYRSIPSVNRFVIAMNNLNSTEFVFDDPDFEPETEQPKQQPVPELHFNNKIQFQNVSYQYPGTSNYVVQNCSLEIKKGEKIGIIGKSGSGKSTLIGNILGFLYPTEGSILIDNTQLNTDTIPQWWKILGYVRQEVFIMNKTFAENIAIGEAKENIDHNRLARAVKLASLSELVNTWPDGVNTMLNERGNNLSGGQKQRIAIARAIYKGAEVLIFDEATSALDSKTEEEITNSIRELGDEDLTIIIIAHRYTSLKYCDKIYELQNGKIAAGITYDKLITEDNNQ
ncbi:MAG: ABC transporter ATP-binding protein [Bacteroidetes bacterium]|nr:ABC transporter ATP-binding protein [Bacteroidota bacterium]